MDNLYNGLFGENEDATALLGMISETRESFLRYRDAYLTSDGKSIIVVSRIGGPLKSMAKDIYKKLKENKLFEKSWDEPSDKTYAYFSFKVPEKYLKTCEQIAPKEPVLSVGDKFKKEIDLLHNDDKDAIERANKIIKFLMANMDEED